MKFLNGKTAYLPTLGPVYSAGKSFGKVLEDILINSENEVFLSFDKNKRWFDAKTEKIILPAVEIWNDAVLIPTKCIFPHNAIKIYYYSDGPLNQADFEKIRIMKKSLCKQEAAERCTLYCFQKSNLNENFICHNIYLKIIDDNDEAALPDDIKFFHELSDAVAGTFGALTSEPELEGFDFLWRKYIKKQKPLGSILCAVENGKIIGAIGPLDIWPDPWKKTWLLPPYFGVKSDSRKKGIGGKLWQAAMSYAIKNSAHYSLVQNKPDSAAAIFYEEHGLINAEQVFLTNL